MEKKNFCDVVFFGNSFCASADGMRNTNDAGNGVKGNRYFDFKRESGNSNYV